MSKKRQKKQKGTAKGRNDRKYSTLADHKHQQNVLTPPIAQLNVHLASWTNDRLPELLWAVLLAGQVERPLVLSAFRFIAGWGQQRNSELGSTTLSLSRLAELPPRLLGEFIGILCARSKGKAAVRPLLLFPQLPGRDIWAQCIADEPVEEDWVVLRTSVAKALFHQSQEATDCRWVWTLFMLALKRIHFAPHMKETFEALTNYHEHPKPELAMAIIRSMEGALGVLEEGNKYSWNTDFWRECLRQTPCGVFEDAAEVTNRIGTTAERVNSVRGSLLQHYVDTLVTTAVDARHDAVFGIALYALGILEELIRPGLANSALGRSGLRTLLESFVTLASLARVDSSDRWKAWRAYGSGQAKLAFLKTATHDLGYVSQETLEGLANEDLWQEYLPINIGHWNGSNLREMSTTAGVKDEYDRYYDWTSAYVHANWGAVRDVVFDVCANPLHRLHRVPRTSSRFLGDVVSDATRLVDRILEFVDKLYPSFVARATVVSPTLQAVAR